MVGKLRIHQATVANVNCSEHNKKFYTIRIEYERRNRHYAILLYEGTKKMNTFKKFLNVKKLEELQGKNIFYIAANDLKEPGKVDIWMLSNKDKTSFLELESGKVLDRKQVKKKIENFVFSEF